MLSSSFCTCPAAPMKESVWTSPALSTVYPTDASTNENWGEDVSSDENVEMELVLHSKDQTADQWEQVRSQLGGVFRRIAREGEDDLAITDDEEWRNDAKEGDGFFGLFGTRIRDASACKSAAETVAVDAREEVISHRMAPAKDPAWAAILESYSAFGVPSGSWSTRPTTAQSTPSNAASGATDGSRIRPSFFDIEDICDGDADDEECQGEDDEDSDFSCDEDQVAPTPRHQSPLPQAGNADDQKASLRWNIVGQRLASVFNCASEEESFLKVPSDVMPAAPAVPTVERCRRVCRGKSLR